MKVMTASSSPTLATIAVMTRTSSESAKSVTLLLRLHGDILPRRVECRPDHALRRRRQMHVGGSALAPYTAAWPEYFRRLPDKRALLRRSQLHHRRARIRVAKRGEDLAVDAEVGMGHVLRFNRAWSIEGKISEIVCGHVAPSLHDDNTSRRAGGKG